MSDEALDTQAESNEEVLDTREFISRELDKLEEKPAEEAAESKDDSRDEKGRFKPKEAKEEKAEEAAPEAAPEVQPEATETPPVEPVQEPRRNHFSAWKKEAQSALSALPPETQQYIVEREQQFHKGIEQYKADAYKGRSLGSAIQPHMDYLNEIGVKPELAISKLIETERTLRTAPPEAKAQMFMKLAHDYGINIQALTNTPFDPYKYEMENKLAEQQRMLQEISQSRQMAEEVQLNQTIESFAEQHEYFEDVRETMADLLDRGLASSLDDAYAKAVRLNDDVFARVQQAQQPAPQVQQVQRADQAAKAAKASAVSVKGSPTGVTRAPEPKSTEEAVRIAMAQMGL